MNKCLTCGEAIKQTKGKRARIYCSDLCRVRHFQRNGKQKVKKTELALQTAAAPVNANEALLKQIAAVKAEPCPSYRTSVLGRKTWAAEQQNRIITLESKLNNK